MNLIENSYEMVLEVKQRENVRTSTHFKTRLFLDRSNRYVLHHCKYIAICSIDVIVDDFDRFDFFFLRLTICQVLNFVLVHRHENS